MCKQVRGIYLVVWLLLFSWQHVRGQCIAGRVTAADPYNTPLSGANIYVAELEWGAATDLRGFFCLEALPDGSHTLRISFIGYVSEDTLIHTPSDAFFNIRLQPDSTLLGELVVEEHAEAAGLSEEAPTSTINISALPIRTIPKLLGEPDLIRIIQNLPGVKAESDFTGGFFVRGGRNDQNLILLDGVPIYNPWHLFGLFSAFNTEALEKVELSKGVFPSNYGSRLSSVLDIGLQEGGKRKGIGALNISLLSVTASYGRALNQKTSYLVSFRRTYLDPLFLIVNQILSSGSEEVNNRYGFTDANFKIVHRLNRQNTLDVGFFWGRDQLRLSSKPKKSAGFAASAFTGRLGWQNRSFTVRHRFRHEKVQINNQLYTTRYHSNNINNEDFIDDDGIEKDREQFVQELSDIAYQGSAIVAPFSLEHPFGSTTLHLGMQIIDHSFKDKTQIHSGTYNGNDSQNPIEVDYNVTDSLQTSAKEYAFFLSAHLGYEGFSLQPGIRWQAYSNGSYAGWLPRLRLTVEPTRSWTVSAGYGINVQYLQILGNDLAQLPTNRWFWADTQRRPATGTILTLGTKYKDVQGVDLTIEGYYKTFDDLLAFSPVELYNANANSDLRIFSSHTISGSGKAYGVELFAQKNRGRLRGWIGYSLSWIRHTFALLNRGRPFFSRNDRRHDIQLLGVYDLSEKWDVSLLFNYKSGQPFTLPETGYVLNTDPLAIGEEVTISPLIVLDQNNFRLPAYHRLDITLTRKNIRVFGRRSDLSFSVINLYNHTNIFGVITDTILERQDNLISVTPNNKYISQFPIIPVVSLRLKLGDDDE